MDKHEHVVTLSAGTKDRVDQLIRSYKVGIAKDILKERFVIGCIDASAYECELKQLYSALGFGRIK